MSRRAAGVHVTKDATAFTVASGTDEIFVVTSARNLREVVVHGNTKTIAARLRGIDELMLSARVSDGRDVHGKRLLFDFWARNGRA